MTELSWPPGLEVDLPAGVPLLAPKLHIPHARPDCVPRPRLLDQLDQGLTGRLILVSGSAGYGKTTVVSQWLATRPHPVAWISLDAGDNDPVRFLRYVVGALQTIMPGLGQTVQSLLQTRQLPPIEFVVTLLVNELCGRQDTHGPAERSLVLVLDDYHLIDAQPVHYVVAFLVDHMPPHMRLILATRADPPLPLSRWRSRGQMVEIRTGDLRFNTGEVATFLDRATHLDLSTEDVGLLETRTEGWPAGLQMAALSLRGRADAAAFIRAFSASHRYVLDYLVEEVLSRQPKAVQTFLLQTSILERLDGSLCDAVTGQAESQAVLERLERTNLFLVPLDDAGRWYRYHHLFADLLYQRLRQSAGAEVIATLRLRAAEWYEREGLVAEAVTCALAAADHAYVATLIARHGLPVYYRGDTVLLHGWLKALPEAVIRDRPLLCAIYASCLMLVQRAPEPFAEAEAWLDEAEAALEEGGPSVGAADVLSRDEILGLTLQFRSYLARFRGDPPQRVIALSLQALERLPAGNSWFRSALYFNLGMAYSDSGDEPSAFDAWDRARQVGEACGDLFNAVSAVYAQAAVTRLRGGLHRAADICREGLRSLVAPAERSGRSLPIAGLLHVGLGIIEVEWDDLEEAERELTRGLTLLALTAAGRPQLEGYFALARLRQGRGDTEAALRVLDEAEQLLTRAKSSGPASPSPARADVASHRVRLWLRKAEDDPRCLAEAQRWAREWELALDAEQDAVAQLTLARLIIAQHRRGDSAALADPPALLRFLGRQLCWAQAKGRVGRQIEVLVLRALAGHVQGDLRQALDALRQALALAEPEGYVRIFLDEGPPLAELLRLGQQRREWGDPPLAGYAGRLLDAFPGRHMDPEADEPVPPRPPSLDAGHIEPLSERELEVLRLMASGLSNQEIAERLYLAVGTVKAHLHHIYGKLGAQGRTQAVARSRELNLL